MAPAIPDHQNDVLLRSSAVRKRYGDASDMWLKRRELDDSGFPRPLVISRTRYWKLSELLAWESRVAKRDDTTRAEFVRALAAHARSRKAERTASTPTEAA